MELQLLFQLLVGLLQQVQFQIKMGFVGGFYLLGA
jgi:hypothetical protein